jgi:CheY-like chemotaxis protein
MLPGMSGDEFRRQQLQEPRLAPIPVVVLAGPGEAADKLDELGQVGFLQKPVEPHELHAAVQRFILPHRPVILVVEDEPMVLKMLDRALRHFGFDVRLAPGGRPAVELFQKEHEGIALVLADVQMPGMDGPETLAALRQIDAEVRYCFMSGDTGQYPIEELLRGGATRVFPKPFRLAELTRELWQVLLPD